MQQADPVGQGPVGQGHGAKPSSTRGRRIWVTRFRLKDLQSLWSS